MRRAMSPPIFNRPDLINQLFTDHCSRSEFSPFIRSERLFTVESSQWNLSDIDGRAREGEDDGHQRCAFDDDLADLERSERRKRGSKIELRHAVLREPQS